jgi:hypothetical protein
VWHARWSLTLIRGVLPRLHHCSSHHLPFCHEGVGVRVFSVYASKHARSSKQGSDSCRHPGEGEGGAVFFIHGCWEWVRRDSLLNLMYPIHLRFCLGQRLWAFLVADMLVPLVSVRLTGNCAAAGIVGHRQRWRPERRQWQQCRTVYTVTLGTGQAHTPGRPGRMPYLSRVPSSTSTVVRLGSGIVYLVRSSHYSESRSTRFASRMLVRSFGHHTETRPVLGSYGTIWLRCPTEEGYIRCDRGLTKTQWSYGAHPRCAPGQWPPSWVVGCQCTTLRTTDDEH